MEKKTASVHQTVSDWRELGRTPHIFHDYEYPKVSIVIPIINSSQLISLTLESLLSQDYPDFEIIIIDAGSTDRTLEVINSYENHRIRIFSVSEYQRYEMLNKGISHSTGTYLNFLFPGDFYISKDALREVMADALHHQKPDLLYCGTLLRDGKSEVKILYRPLSLELLKRGQQPTSLQSCWFNFRTFTQIGKFDASLSQRGGYDVLCRFMLESNLTFTPIHRVWIDYDLRWVTRKDVVTHFFETCFIIKKYFGVLASLKWFFYQKDLSRFFRLWLKNIKIALLGRA